MTRMVLEIPEKYSAVHCVVRRLLRVIPAIHQSLPVDKPACLLDRKLANIPHEPCALYKTDGVPSLETCKLEIDLLSYPRRISVVGGLICSKS